MAVAGGGLAYAGGLESKLAMTGSRSAGRRPRIAAHSGSSRTLARSTVSFAPRTGSPPKDSRS